VPVLEDRLGEVQDHVAERGRARHAGRHHPAAAPVRPGEERRDLLAAVHLDRLVLGRGQVAGQAGQIAQGAGDQGHRHPFGIFFMGKTTVGERFAQHGDDALSVAV